MTDYLIKHNIAKQFSAAYKQHQNGVAESLWNRLTPLIIILLRAAPWLGIDFWFEAMLYANQMLQRRPSFGNSDMSSPDEDFYGVAASQRPFS
jgi:hypothetical protein